jgi:hypothetical protein
MATINTNENEVRPLPPLVQGEAAPALGAPLAPAPATTAVPAPATVVVPAPEEVPPPPVPKDEPLAQHARVADTSHPSTDSHPADPVAPKTAPTASIDPNIPSSESAPTALPTNANTHPDEQKEAIKHEHPEVIKREVEKTKAAEREIKGEPALGTIVRGIEDDRLNAMLRMFDTVCFCHL